MDSKGSGVIRRYYYLFLCSAVLIPDTDFRMATFQSAAPLCSLWVLHVTRKRWQVVAHHWQSRKEGLN